MGTELVKKESGFSLVPKTLDEAIRFSELLSKSKIVPESYQGKPGDILVAIQMGTDLGLKPLQCLQNIAVIKGRPAIWGDALVALVRASGQLEYIMDEDDGKECTVRCKRKGEPEIIRRFSQADAKAAGLVEKSFAWKKYPARMRFYRARAFALRDLFADALGGLILSEVSEDYEPTPEPFEMPERASEIHKHPDPVTADDEAQEEPDAVDAEVESLPEEQEQDSELIGRTEQKWLFALVGESKATKEEFKDYIKETFSVDSTKEIKEEWLADIVTWIKERT